MAETLSSQPSPSTSGSELSAGILRGLIGDGLMNAEQSRLADVRAELVAEGENLDSEYGRWWLRQQFGDSRILQGLAETERRTGVPLKEFVRHSYRFSRLKAETALITKGRAAIPQGEGNVHHDGRLRRHEEGPRLNLDEVRKQGVDPALVLYYRVTQPSSEPRPEYYWTSDSLEVRRGLGGELGSQEAGAIVLASTLEVISENGGGLILDVNEDHGIAVRQIGLGAFDQRKALFSFARAR